MQHIFYEPLYPKDFRVQHFKVRTSQKLSEILDHFDAFFGRSSTISRPNGRLFPFRVLHIMKDYGSAVSLSYPGTLLVHPVMRQIFAHTSGLIWKPILQCVVSKFGDRWIDREPNLASKNSTTLFYCRTVRCKSTVLQIIKICVLSTKMTLIYNKY